MHLEEHLQELINNVCGGFPTRDVEIINVFDQRRFARLVHYAWKQGIGFHPDMFMNALKETELFKGLSEKEIETKAHELCNKADFAKSMFHAAFELENLSI